MQSPVLIAASAAAVFTAPVLAFAHPAHAQEDAVRQVVVRYGDLNLNTPAGKAALKTRLRSAAESVCGARPDIRSLLESREFDLCVHKSLDTATAAVPAATMVAGSNGPHG